MASINKVILIGNLGRDPETRYTTDGGTAITTLNIATTRRYRNAEGQTVSETDCNKAYKKNQKSATYSAGCPIDISSL